jgi:hypothetical protein
MHAAAHNAVGFSSRTYASSPPPARGPRAGRGARRTEAGPSRPVPCGCSGRVSSRGVTQVAGQRLPVGYAHRHTLVDIDVHDAEFHVYDQAGEPLVVIPRTSSKEVTRTKGYSVRDRVG